MLVESAYVMLFVKHLVLNLDMTPPKTNQDRNTLRHSSKFGMGLECCILRVPLLGVFKGLGVSLKIWGWKLRQETGSALQVRFPNPTCSSKLPKACEARNLTRLASAWITLSIPSFEKVFRMVWNDMVSWLVDVSSRPCLEFVNYWLLIEVILVISWCEECPLNENISVNLQVYPVPSNQFYLG